MLLFMPVYQQDRPQATVADRRQHLSGWVFAVFGLGDLVASLYGESTPGMDLRSTSAAARACPCSSRQTCGSGCQPVTALN